MMRQYSFSKQKKLAFWPHGYLADAEAATPVGADGGTAVAIEVISDGAALRRSAVDSTKVDADAGHAKETANE